MASNKISTQKINAIKKSYEGGLSLNKIEKKHNTDKDTVKRLATKNNWERPLTKPELEIQDDTRTTVEISNTIDGETEVKINYPQQYYDAIEKSATKILNEHFNENKSPKQLYEEDGLSIEEISKITGKPRWLLWGWKKAFRWKRQNDNWKGNLSNSSSEQIGIGIPPRQDIVEEIYSPKMTTSKNNNSKEYQSKVTEFKKFIGEGDLPFTAKEPTNFGNNQKEVTLVMGDNHVPYHDEVKTRKAVQDFLQKFVNIPFKRLVINGDYIDGYPMNSFGKDDNHVSLKEELRQGRILLSWLSSLFDEVILVDGNHDQGRQDRYREQQLLTDLSFTMRDINDLMVEGMPNVRRAKKVYKNGEEFGWFTIIGDAMIGHYEVSTSYPMGATVKFSEWVDTWSHELGFPKIRIVIEGHVHGGGELYVKGKDRKLIEGGCLASPKALRYAMKPNAKGGKPSINGVTHLVQENGVSDFNETRFIHY